VLMDLVVTERDINNLSNGNWRETLEGNLTGDNTNTIVCDCKPDAVQSAEERSKKCLRDLHRYTARRFEWVVC